jgi:DNA-binding transcriptional LysR family regulator
MELNDLRYFWNVATARSFSQGAKLSFVSPPAISKAIKRLEDELKAQLLVRTTRSVHLTDRGEILLDHCRKIFRQIDDLERDLHEAAETIRGDFRIGTNEVFSTYLLPHALAQVVREHPGLSPRSYQMVPSQIVHGLKEGSLDLGFTIGRDVLQGVEVIPLASSKGVLVCGVDHPLYEKGVVTKEDLLTYPSVVPEFFRREYLPSQDNFPNQRFPRRVGATIELMQMGIQMAFDGAYLGYFPEVSISCQLSHGELKALQGLETGVPFQLNAVVRKGREARAAVQLVIDTIKATIEESIKKSCVIEN